jgi:hypothetical protein
MGYWSSNLHYSIGEYMKKPVRKQGSYNRMKNGLQIFVFGSNLAGRHGAGSALEVLQKHRAVYGKGVGLQGQSYAIPTKDEELNTLPLEQIKEHVEVFLAFAERMKRDMVFNVVKIGCGLAGYKEEQIKPMFKNAPENCNLPKGWRD